MGLQLLKALLEEILKDLSRDQNLLYRYVKAIISGTVPTDLKDQKPGPLAYPCSKIDDSLHKESESLPSSYQDHQVHHPGLHSHVVQDHQVPPHHYGPQAYL